MHPIVGDRVLSDSPQFFRSAALADGGPGGHFFQLGHDFEELIGEQAGEAALSFRAGLAPQREGRLHDTEQTGTAEHARR